MKNELCSAGADQIEYEVQGEAITSANQKIEVLIQDCGPKVKIVDHRMVITEEVTPDEALRILLRLKHEAEANDTSLKHIRLWMGDFALQYAKQMGVPMSKAANELAEVFGEKPKRIMRLANTSERSPEEFRVIDVDYTVLQDIADIAEVKDPEQQKSVEDIKLKLLKEVGSGEKDRGWLKKQISTLRKVTNPEEKPKATLEAILVQFYNLTKLFAECPNADTCEQIENSIKALEPSIENLANARGHKLYFEMEEPPLVDGIAEVVNIDEIIP